MEHRQQDITVRGTFALALLLPCLVALACAGTREPETASAAKRGDPDVLGILHQMAEQGQKPDFWSLREGFSRSVSYSPYGHGELDDLTEKVFGQLEQGDAAGAFRGARRMLELSPLHPQAHLAALRAAEALEDRPTVDFHRWVLTGMLDSICGERSGQDPEDPCPVIATYEEYFFLYSQGFQLVEQALDECAGRPCDLMEVEDPETGDHLTFFFDISRPMGYLSRRFGED